jgi:hypothetical protein
MVRPPRKPQERSPEETKDLREAILKRLLRTPPKRHAEMVTERKTKRKVIKHMKF